MFTLGGLTSVTCSSVVASYFGQARAAPAPFGSPVFALVYRKYFDVIAHTGGPDRYRLYKEIARDEGMPSWECPAIEARCK